MLRNATSTMTAVFLCFLNEVLSLNAQEYTTTRLEMAIVHPQ